MVEAADSFFCATIWASCSLLKVVDLATLESCYKFDIFNDTVSHLASEHTIAGFPLSSMRATRGTRSTAERNTKLVTHFLDDQHSELYGEREQLLKLPSFRHHVDRCENSDNSPSSTAGSRFEHDRFFCTRRVSKIADNSLSQVDIPWRPVRLSSLLVPEKAMRERWKSRGGRRVWRQRKLLQCRYFDTRSQWEAKHLISRETILAARIPRWTELFVWLHFGSTRCGTGARFLHLRAC